MAPLAVASRERKVSRLSGLLSGVEFPKRGNKAKIMIKSQKNLNSNLIGRSKIKRRNKALNVGFAVK